MRGMHLIRKTDFFPHKPFRLRSVSDIVPEPQLNRYLERRMDETEDGPVDLPQHARMHATQAPKLAAMMGLVMWVADSSNRNSILGRNNNRRCTFL